MNDQLKPIEIGYGDEKIIFYMRMISIAEEDAVNKRLAELKDIEGDELYRRQYEITKDALRLYAAKSPELKKGEKTEPLESDYFKERTAIKERVVTGAFYLFKSLLNPEVTFLPPSPPPAGTTSSTASEGEN